jgi:hypothetical protein
MGKVGNKAPTLFTIPNWDKFPEMSCKSPQNLLTS